MSCSPFDYLPRLLLPRVLVNQCIYLVLMVPLFAANAAPTVAHYQRLENPSQWEKLLHFDNGSTNIESDWFFLAAEQNPSPQAEFQAMLRAFNQTGSLTHCRFPARYLWISRAMHDDFGLSLTECDQYLQWQKSNAADSISLIYVTGYMGNPASFFGHLLMKFNQQDETENINSPLLDVGINFGANAHPDDNPIKYVTYGLFGGYTSSFSLVGYYQQTNNYSENEQRELWEYRLNLTAWEVTLLQAHLWELNDVAFRYYFLAGNCATAMAKFINIVVDSPLLVENQPWDMPIDLFNALPDISHHNQPLVREIIKRDSLYGRIYRKYTALSASEKNWVQGINTDFSQLKKLNSEPIPATSKAKILDVLLEYSELLITTGDSEETHKNKERKRQLMMSRLRFEHPKIIWPEITTAPPHEAQPPVKIATGIGYNQQLGWYTQLGVHAAYYDFLALETARFKDSEITVLDSEIGLKEDKIWLKKVDLFNVATLNTNQVDLFPNDRYAWQVKMSAEQYDLGCTQCLRTYLTGYAGKADKWHNDISAYAMAGIKIDINYIQQSQLQVPLGILYTAGAQWKTRLRIIPSMALDSGKTDLHYRWENRFGSERSWDIRFNITHQHSTEANLYYQWYF